MKRVAFIGLGTMGYPMAGHLAKAGHDVVVYNRTGSRAEAWCAEFGGRAATLPCQAAEGAELVFLCVGRDDDVREVVCGDSGVLGALEHGSVIVDHTTTSAVLARELSARCLVEGVDFIDAPVSGGQQGALQGRLTIMCGGDARAFSRVEPGLGCYAQTVSLLGPVGSGQLCKMVNQICIAGLLEGLAEGLAFAKSAGLNQQAVIDVISRGAAQSWQMDNRHSTMIEGRYDFGFAVDWMRKDLGIVLDEARRNGAALPVTALVDQFYGDIQNMGGGRWDTSSLYARLQQIKTPDML